MEWQIVVALTLAIPIVLLPVVFVWYLNLGALVAAFQRSREKRASGEEQVVAADVEVQ